jgi:hypothetical protein
LNWNPELKLLLLLLLKLFEELIGLVTVLFPEFCVIFPPLLFWEFSEIFPFKLLLWEFNKILLFILLFTIKHFVRSAFNIYPFSHCWHIFAIGHFKQFIIVLHFWAWVNINFNEIKNMNIILLFWIPNFIFNF